MGVPKFYRWVSERYPCLSQVLKEHQVRRRPRGAGAGRHPGGLGRRQGPSAALRSAGARGPVRGPGGAGGPPGGSCGPGRRSHPARLAAGGALPARAGLAAAGGAVLLPRGPCAGARHGCLRTQPRGRKPGLLAENGREVRSCGG